MGLQFLNTTRNQSAINIRKIVLYLDNFLKICLDIYTKFQNLTTGYTHIHSEARSQGGVAFHISFDYQNSVDFLVAF